MTHRRVLVVDTNILMRGVLGLRVLNLLQGYEDIVAFCAPDICFQEAKKHLPAILRRRGIADEVGFAILDQISKIVESIARNVYQPHEELAKQRIFIRDPDDWPVVATALSLKCPIWT